MKQIRAMFRGANAIKHKFCQSQCLITISVGQESHEGERFAATRDLLNQSFASCIMLVDDSLQRHTMAVGRPFDADHYYDISIKEGLKWLERNEKYLKKFNILKKTMHWDHWLNHADFKKQQQNIRLLYENNSIYKNAFDHAIEEFLLKYSKRLKCLDGFDFERARQLSFDFVLEECTALSLWPELSCQFEVYPNRHNQAIEATRQYFVLSKYPDLLQPVTVGFRNASQIKPQQFELLNEK